MLILSIGGWNLVWLYNVWRRRGASVACCHRRAAVSNILFEAIAACSARFILRFLEAQPSQPGQARKECVTKSICQISLWTSEASQRESWLLPAAAPTIVRATTTTVDLATIEVTVVSLLKSCLCNFKVNYILTYESKWTISLLAYTHFRGTS